MTVGYIVVGVSGPMRTAPPHLGLYFGGSPVTMFETRDRARSAIKATERRGERELSVHSSWWQMRIVRLETNSR